MNIDLTKEEIELIIEVIDGDLPLAKNMRAKLKRHLQPEGHSPETETKEGVVDTSKNKNWKVL